MSQTLIEYVKSRIDPKEYYSKVFPDIRWPSGGGEPRVMCCFHKDKSTPSLHVNGESGAYYCHGCGAGGNHIISFHAAYRVIKPMDAAAELFDEHIHPTIGAKKVRRWRSKLRKTPIARRYVHSRLVTRRIMRAADLGWDGEHIMFPIKNEFGFIVNVKSYNPLAKRGGKIPKMLNYRVKDEDKTYGSPPMLYPLWAMKIAKEKQYVVICEGEWDALFLLSMGIPAVTSTAGSKSWPKQYNEEFRGLKVIIAYDNDKDGTKYDRLPMKQLSKIALEIRRLKIPKFVNGQKTKDVNEWGLNDRKMLNPKAWRKLFKKAELILHNTPEMINQSEAEPVPLDQASQAKWFNRRIQVDALISGKHTAPYLLPSKARVTCDQSCDDCPLLRSGKSFKDVKLEGTDPKMLDMIDSAQEKVHRMCIQAAGVKMTPSCKGKCEVLETLNIEKILLIPTLDSKTQQYVTRWCYYVGHGLKTNRAYRFEGTTTANPDDQQATHLFDDAKTVQDELDTFRMTPELGKQLEIFRPRNLKLMAHLMNIADWQSRNITKIRERPDMHIAVDLVFHSLHSFNFCDEVIRRGMLDVLVVGDTRCGKGYIAENIVRYLGLGEVASGEMCSFAGLVGGLQQVGNNWIITWGAIPLNHGRMVIIDEASSLSEDNISKMSRMRSEGVCEINMIKRESTQANTRLLWLSNSRDGQPITRRNYGVETIKSLIGANEDISRFDFAMTVATNEVPSEVINSEDEVDTSDSAKYPRDLCRALVLWAWSRRPDQVKFTPKAIKAIIRNAIEFGNEYSPTIPLVQAENIRIKLAKISAAVAARVFSADASYETVIVKSEHVKCACSFLRMIYSKPSMAYDLYSRAAVNNNTMRDNSVQIAKIFGQIDNVRETIDGLLVLNRITSDTLADYIGDPLAAKALLSDLVKARCINRNESSNYYMKNTAFSAWLRQYRKGIRNGQHESNGY